MPALRTILTAIVVWSVLSVILSYVAFSLLDGTRKQVQPSPALEKNQRKFDSLSQQKETQRGEESETQDDLTKHPKRVPEIPPMNSSVPIAHVRQVDGWAQMLNEIADQDGVVLYTMGTPNYVHIMNSFFLTSVAPHGIQNFLFVALGSGMCSKPGVPGTLHPHAACVEYPTTIEEGGDIGQKAFLNVVQKKSDILLGILQEGYTAFLTDADVHFLRNPMKTLRQQSETQSADLVIQDDGPQGKNSGFMYVRPSAWGVEFQGRIVKRFRDGTGELDQPATNAVINELENATPFKMQVLPSSTFPCGLDFFLNKGRMFAWNEPCMRCVVVHNNYIVSDVAKTYRARELLQWAVDADEYYSSPHTKYLVFGNPAPSEKLPASEQEALKTALKLGAVLNRTVVLPWLRCRGVRGVPEGADACSLNAKFLVKSWAKLGAKYPWREMMFRYNPLTHPDVRLASNLETYTYWARVDARVNAGYHDPTLGAQGLSSLAMAEEPAHFVSTASIPTPPAFGNVFRDEAPADRTQVSKTREDGVITAEEARQVWGGIEDRVLRFHSLYGLRVQWDAAVGDEAEFELLWRAAIKRAPIKQG